MATQRGTKKSFQVISTVLLFVIALLVPVGLYSNWAVATVGNKERFVETFAPLATNYEVQKSLSLSVENLVEDIDVESVLEEYLPPVLAPASGLLASGVKSSVTNLVDRFIYSDQFAMIWTRLTEALHTQLIAVLEGETDTFVRAGDDGLFVTIEPVREALLERVAQVQVLSLLTPRIEAAELPRLQILNGEQLGFITFVWDTNKFVGLFVWPLIFFAGIVSVLLRRSMWRGGVYVGVSVIIGAIITLMSVAITRTRIEAQLAEGIFGRAISEIFGQLTLALQHSSYWTIATGVVIIAAFAGWALLLKLKPELVHNMFDTVQKAIPAPAPKKTSGAASASRSAAVTKPSPAPKSGAAQKKATTANATKKPAAKKPAAKKPAAKKKTTS